MEMLYVVDDCEELTQALDGVQYGGMAVGRASLNNFFDKLEDYFLNLLEFRGPESEVRQRVNSGVIQSEVLGEMQLLREDAIMIIQMSDDLQIREVDAVEYISRANKEGSCTQEAATGLYFSDRMSVLTCLHRIFSLLAFNEDAAKPGSEVEMMLGDVKAFCDRLLLPIHNGHSKIVHRLVELIKQANGEIEKGEDRLDSRFQSLPAGSPSSMVFDFMGGHKPKSAMWVEEQRVLCDILLLAVKLHSRIPVNSIMDLIGLMAQLNQRIHEASNGPGNGPSPYMINAILVLFSLMTTLLPQDMPQGMTAANADESKLEDLAKNTQLGEAFSDDPAEGDPFNCVIRFAWGVLKGNYRATVEQGKKLMKKCSSVGVLNALNNILHDECLETRCQLEIHGLCLSIAHNLLVHFLEIENKNIIGKTHDLYKVTTQRVMAHWNEHIQAEEQKDHLCHVLDILKEVYEQRPDLMIKQRPESVVKFVGWIPDSGLLQDSPEVFHSFVRLWSGVATGTEGARQIHDQLYLCQKKGLHTISKGYERCQWGFIICTLIKITTAVQGTESAQPRRIGKDDLKALLAYLRLIRKVLSEAPLFDAAKWVIDLELEYQEPLSGKKIRDVLIHLLCQPVPHELKASINKTLVAFGRTINQARSLLYQLKDCTILRNQDPNAGGQSDGDRYDLLYQLNQIEASAEVYPESLGFVRLINALMKNAHPVPDQAFCVKDCTKFVVDGLLPRLGHLKFQSPTQQWELMASCFSHLILVLENTNSDPDVVRTIKSKMGAQPPGYRIIEDVLGNGRIFGMICQVLARSNREFQGEGFSRISIKTPKHDAIIAALSLLCSVFQHDLKFLRSGDHGGIVSLDKLLLRLQREEVFSIIGYVRIPCGLIQVQAISVVKHLAARDSGFMDLFSGAPRYVNEVMCLKEGFARALHAGLLEPNTVEDLESTVQPLYDTRAALILRLLLENLPKSSVNIGHLLCGFDISEGLDSFESPDLSQLKGSNCLMVIKESLGSMLSISKPQLYCHCLEVIRELGGHPRSAAGLSAMLKSQEDTFLLDLLLEALLAAELWSGAENTLGHWVVIQSQAVLLDIVMRFLLGLKPKPDNTDYTLCAEVLKRLLGLMPETEPGSVPLVSILWKIPVTKRSPSVNDFLERDSMNALRDYGRGPGGPVQVLRLTNKSLDDGGLMYTSRTGQELFDYQELCGRLESWLQNMIRNRTEIPLDNNQVKELMQHLGDGCNQICSFVVAHNAHVKLQSACLECLNSYDQAMGSLLETRWEVFSSVCNSSDQFTALQLLVQMSIVVVNMLAECDSPKLCLPLCRLVEKLLKKLHKEALSSKTDITDLFLLPDGPDLLSGMTTILSYSDSRVSQEGKFLLMSSITLFLSISKCDTEKLMLQSAKIIRDNDVFLIGILNREINNEPAGIKHQLVALQTLRQLINVEGSIDIVQTILSSTSIFQDICGALKIGLNLYLSPGAPDDFEETTVSQLELILEMCCAGGPEKTVEISRIMNNYQVIPWVCSSSVLEHLPEEWPVKKVHDMTVISKLHQTVILTLRIMDRVVSGLDGFGDARQKVAAVIEAHAKQFNSILLRACSLRWGDWEPCKYDVQIAHLSVGLLAMVGMENFTQPTQILLHESVNRLAESFCCLATVSESPYVSRIMVQPFRERTDAVGEALWSIRKSLIAYYHKALLYILVNRAANAVDLPSSGLLCDAIQQSLMDLKELLDEREWSFHLAGSDAKLMGRYRRHLEDIAYILLNSCRIGSYALVAWFKRGFQSEKSKQSEQYADLAQHIMMELDPLLRRTLSMGPEDSPGFREVHESWKMLKIHVEMQDRGKELAIIR